MFFCEKTQAMNVQKNKTTQFAANDRTQNRNNTHIIWWKYKNTYINERGNRNEKENVNVVGKCSIGTYVCSLWRK